MFALLARAVEQRVCELTAQDLANTAWAFATAGHSAVVLFRALATAVEWLIREFNLQDLANTAWAFAMAGDFALVLLNPISMLSTMEGEDAKPQLLDYQMLMESLAATGQIQAGIALLHRVEASGMLSHLDENCDAIVYTLLETCRAVGTFDSASQIQAAVEWLGMIALAPAATALAQGTERQCEKQVIGVGIVDARKK